MSILNDVEIRKRCLVPTHKWTANSFNNRNLIPNTFLFSEMNGVFYNVNTGLPYSEREMVAFRNNLAPFEGEFLQKRMITPFREKLRDEGVISYGLSSFGYDATCGSTFKLINPEFEGILDPKNVDENAFITIEGDYCIIPPHGFALTYTNETFDIPEDIMSICMAKSTMARLGLVVGVTPLEPGWRGQVTIELSNTTDIPIKVYANEGICQFYFLQGSPSETPYNVRGGKYMDQVGIVLPRILQAKE